MSSRYPHNTERGAAIVESAIIMLGFFFVLLGVMEAGRFMSVRQIVTDAAREGARYGVAPFSGTDSLPAVDDIPGVIDLVNEFLGSGVVDQANTTTAADGSAPAGWTCVITDATGTDTTIRICQTDAIDGTFYTQLTVTSTYTAMIPLFNVLNIPIVGEVRMRNETSV